MQNSKMNQPNIEAWRSMKRRKPLHSRALENATPLAITNVVATTATSLHKAEFTGCPTSPAWTVLSPELPPDSQTFMPGTSVTCRMDEEQLHRSYDVFARPRSRADYASSSPLAQRSMRSATFRAKLMPRLAHQTFPTALYRDCSILILVPERLWFLAAHFRSLAQVYRSIAQNK
jgi:hypothetical protein